MIKCLIKIKDNDFKSLRKNGTYSYFWGEQDYFDTLEEAKEFIKNLNKPNIYYIEEVTITFEIKFNGFLYGDILGKEFNTLEEVEEFLRKIMMIPLFII